MKAGDTSVSGKPLIIIHACTRDRLHSLAAFVISSVCTLGEELQRNSFIRSIYFNSIWLENIKAFFSWRKTRWIKMHMLLWPKYNGCITGPARIISFFMEGETCYVVHTDNMRHLLLNRSNHAVTELLYYNWRLFLTM